MRLLIFFILQLITVAVFAQDTLQTKNRLPVRINKNTSVLKTKATSFTAKQSVEIKINRFLDSAVQTNNSHFLLSIKSGIENILFQQWRSGMLLGIKPEQAYYVLCGKNTMTTTDIANGKLVVVIGCAFTKPAEFEEMRFERMIKFAGYKDALSAF